MVKGHGLAWGIIFIGVLLRAIYAVDLPVNPDEMENLKIAQSISIRPGQIHLPLGHSYLGHPILTEYLIAFGLYIGNGSVYILKLFFLLLNLSFFTGVYFLALKLFDYRVAIAALLFASLDRYLINYSVTFTGQHLLVVPWIVYCYYDLANAESEDWKFAANLYACSALFGVGYMLYEPLMLLGVPLLLHAVYTKNILRILKSKHLYISLAVFLFIISPEIIWNLNHSSKSISTHARKIIDLGISPRVLILFFGDIFITMSDLYWILLSHANEVYVPYRIPCDFIMGSIYFVSIIFSFQYIRKEKYFLLYMIIIFISFVVTVIRPDEPYNNFWWASMILVPCILIASDLTVRLYFKRIMPANIVLFAILAAILFFNLRFIAGVNPNYTSFNDNIKLAGLIYSEDRGFSLNWQGRYIDNIEKNINRDNLDGITTEMFLGILTSNNKKIFENLNILKSKYKDSPLTDIFLINIHMQNNNNPEAYLHINKLIDAGYDNFIVRIWAADVSYDLGRYGECYNHIQKILQKKSDHADVYKLQFLCLLNMDKKEEAREVIELYVHRQRTFNSMEEGYAEVANILSAEGWVDFAGEYLKKSHGK